MENLASIGLLVDEAPKDKRIWWEQNFKCPYCNTHNWITQEDPSFINYWAASRHIEAIECYSCNKRFWLASKHQTHYAEMWSEPGWHPTDLPTGDIIEDEDVSCKVGAATKDKAEKLFK